MTLELSVPYRMDESCNFRTLTPLSKISLASQESRVMTLELSITYTSRLRHSKSCARTERISIGFFITFIIYFLFLFCIGTLLIFLEILTARLVTFSAII